MPYFSILIIINKIQSKFVKKNISDCQFVYDSVNLDMKKI